MICSCFSAGLESGRLAKPLVASTTGCLSLLVGVAFSFLFVVKSFEGLLSFSCLISLGLVCTNLSIGLLFLLLFIIIIAVVPIPINNTAAAAILHHLTEITRAFSSLRYNDSLLGKK